MTSSTATPTTLPWCSMSITGPSGRAGLAAEARHEVDHGDDGAADVDQPADVRRRSGETRGGRRRKDFPHDLQLDPTDSVRQSKEQQLAGRYVRV